MYLAPWIFNFITQNAENFHLFYASATANTTIKGISLRIAKHASETSPETSLTTCSGSQPHGHEGDANRAAIEETYLNLTYRSFCQVDLTKQLPGHASIAQNRHGRNRECGVSRHLFETASQRCMDEAVVGGHTITAMLIRRVAETVAKATSDTEFSRC